MTKKDPADLSIDECQQVIDLHRVLYSPYNYVAKNSVIPYQDQVKSKRNSEFIDAAIAQLYEHDLSPEALQQLKAQAAKHRAYQQNVTNPTPNQSNFRQLHDQAALLVTYIESLDSNFGTKLERLETAQSILRKIMYHCTPSSSPFAAYRLQDRRLSARMTLEKLKQTPQSPATLQEAIRTYEQLRDSYPETSQTYQQLHEALIVKSAQYEKTRGAAADQKILAAAQQIFEQKLVRYNQKQPQAAAKIE